MNTPRTNEEIYIPSNILDDSDDEDGAVVKASLAKTLEIELNAEKEVCDKAFDILRMAFLNIQAFTDPEGNMPEDTGEFNDLKDSMIAIREFLEN